MSQIEQNYHRNSTILRVGGINKQLPLNLSKDRYVRRIGMSTRSRLTTYIRAENKDEYQKYSTRGPKTDIE